MLAALAPMKLEIGNWKFGTEEDSGKALSENDMAEALTVRRKGKTLGCTCCNSGAALRAKKPFCSSPVSRTSGFTLIEIVMVLVIIGFSMAIIFPALGRSIAGNRVRMASRLVVMSGRYARSMAVLKQHPIAVKFDLGAGKITILSKEDGGVLTTRQLEKVKIREVQIGEEDIIEEGTCEIIYQNNGTCMPYVVKIVDDQGRSVTIEVDELSSARTENG